MIGAGLFVVSVNYGSCLISLGVSAIFLAIKVPFRVARKEIKMDSAQRLSDKCKN